MRLKILSIPLLLHRSIALCPRIIQYHRLVEQLKALHLFYSAGGGFCIFKNNEGLAPGSEIGFGDKVNDISIFGEDFSEGCCELFDFYAFFEVFDLERFSGSEAD